MNKYIVVFCTVPDKKTGHAIAKSTVEDKLAACVTISGPVESCYTWKGKIEVDQELLLIIKTQSALFSKLEEKIKALHPYEVPEIIALPIIQGHSPYLDWIADETSS